MKTKCKLCTWTTEEKGENAMSELRKHWSGQHHAKYVEVQSNLAKHDVASRFCSSCGKSQLSAGFIATCKGCLGWFCPDCTSQHTRCSRHNSKVVQEAA